MLHCVNEPEQLSCSAEHGSEYKVRVLNTWNYSVVLANRIYCLYARILILSY
jgi:hypothetical protein